jgi:hypothetical protein
MKVLNRRFRSFSLQLNPNVRGIKSGSFKKETGSGVRRVKVLLNLSCSVNYDSTRNPSKPHSPSQCHGKPSSTPI